VVGRHLYLTVWLNTIEAEGLSSTFGVNPRKAFLSKRR
jgi:hypothetical protein